MTHCASLVVLMAVLVATPLAARDGMRPAELPPADYAGQQYVDSKGCMFVRAGTAAEVLWIPRVSRDGQPFCGNPPSGQRVPVAEEVGVAQNPSAESPVSPDDSGAVAPATPDPVTTDAATGGYFVAVGSFGVIENADKAEAKLRGLSYGVVRGRLQGGGTTLVTVFAGPFPDADTAATARQNLQSAGFPDATVMGP